MNPIDENAVLGSRMPDFLVRPVARWLAFDWFNKSYREVRENHDTEGGAFLADSLAHLGIHYEVTEDALARIPAKGPVIVVSNHPFGVADALILAEVLLRRRSDARLLGNSLIAAMPEARDILIPVDPFGGAGAARRNIAGLRDALAHLQSGGLIGLFPAGEVAHFSFAERRIREKAWSKHLIQMVAKSGADVVPVHFEGRNSVFFHAAGLVHPLLRTAQLLREFRRLSGRTIRIEIGRPIPARRIPRADYEKGAAFVQRHVELLGTASREKRWQVTREGKKLSPAELEPLVLPVEPDGLEVEIAALPEDRLLLTRGAWRCFIAGAAEIPRVLREIGRLREKTFRSVGEGTGQAIDLDEYDQWYQHLFLWNGETRQIGGAYRLGPSDEITERRGVQGLYTRSLFRYKREFFHSLGGPAVELGRSFVVEECQKGYLSLGMLFLGIGEFLRRNPRFRYAFGAVSISGNYLPVSRNLMVQFLEKHAFSTDFAHLVRPGSRSVDRETSSRTRDRLGEIAEGLETIEQIDAAVGSLEQDGKGVPILLRQYTKFHATYLGFNVDAKFSGCLDGLMIVDLTRIAPRVGDRFLGAGVVHAIRKAHGLDR